MGTIKMTVVPIDWTMGDVGHVFIKLRKGSCRIDWGDGKSTPLFTYKEDWLSANHTYPSGCKISKEPFEITITSLEDNIIGFRADSGDMMVSDVDIRECQSLEYLCSSWLIEKLDVTTNPGIREIDVRGDAADLIDLSRSSELESLICNYSNRKSLNLSRCNKLTYLECVGNSHLKKLVVSNNSMLNEVLLEGTELDSKSLKYLRATLKRNRDYNDDKDRQLRIEFEI